MEYINIYSHINTKYMFYYIYLNMININKKTLLIYNECIVVYLNLF